MMEKTVKNKFTGTVYLGFYMALFTVVSKHLTHIDELFLTIPL